MVNPDLWSDIDVVAHTVYGEARGESEGGQAAVAWVIKNRAAKGRSYMGTTLREVCFKPYQFSCWNSKDVNRTILLNLDTNDRDYKKIRRIVEEVLSEQRPDNTNGSTHYHAKNTKCNWAKDKAPVDIIGAHLFYNNID